MRVSLLQGGLFVSINRSFLHKILDYEDEFFAALMLILEGHSLRTTNALFVESLYGLRRKSVRLRLSKVCLSIKSIKLVPLSLEREVRLWESLWRSEDQGFDEANFFTGEETIVSRRDNGNHELSV
ncbi:hypothetical protein DY000_02038456 [Brassica cretica]|uniref:Pex N-terminal domain-containing protein n=1 Tax=Brassica cretica TaxID=69181 RepID=A0ABQ7BCZ3_BRACR|nr:hypothetical protein DY000_02038456 [Brassica cretica]